MKINFLVSLTVVLTLVLSSCGTSNNVVGGGMFQKRKYNSGFYWNKKSNLNEATVKNEKIDYTEGHEQKTVESEVANSNYSKVSNVENSISANKVQENGTSSDGMNSIQDNTFSGQENLVESLPVESGKGVSETVENERSAKQNNSQLNSSDSNLGNILMIVLLVLLIIIILSLLDVFLGHTLSWILSVVLTVILIYFLLKILGLID